MGHLAGLIMFGELARFYAGRTVLVTGDTGFKGSWLSLWLHHLGAKVHGLALPCRTDQDHFRLLGLQDVISHQDLDIRDGGGLNEVLERIRPEVVFHLAAQALVRPSYADPVTTFATNILGTVHVLDAVRKSSSVRSLVCITSDKCYRNKEWAWGYRENDELGGHDPYSASKACAELVFASYMDSFLSSRNDLGAATTRAGNVVGGGDWAQDRIVPDCMRALLSEQPIVIRSPRATRPWQHVLEPLSGYLLLGMKLFEKPKVFSGAWNFGPRVESIRTVGDLAETIVQDWGSGTVERKPNPNDVHECGLLSLNCDKAHQHLDWFPRWDFPTTVAKTVCWYQEVAQGKGEPGVVSRRQIREYQESRPLRVCTEGACARGGKT